MLSSIGRMLLCGLVLLVAPPHLARATPLGLDFVLDPSNPRSGDELILRLTPIGGGIGVDVGIQIVPRVLISGTSIDVFFDFIAPPMGEFHAQGYFEFDEFVPIGALPAGSYDVFSEVRFSPDAEPVAQGSFSFVVAVPEPSGGLLICVGLVAIGASVRVVRRRTRRSNRVAASSAHSRA